MLVVVYSSPDGGVTEVIPSPFARLCSGFDSGGVLTTVDPPTALDILTQAIGAIPFTPIYAETEEEFVSRIQAKDVPQDAPNQTVLDDSALPGPETLRYAWVLNNGLVSVSEQRTAAYKSEQVAKMSVSPRQARLALRAAGLLDQVTVAVNAAGGDTLITWEYATEFLRSSPLIKQLGTSLNISDDVVDQLFIAAATY